MTCSRSCWRLRCLGSRPVRRRPGRAATAAAGGRRRPETGGHPAAADLRRPGGRRQTGSAAIELVLITPVLIALIFALVQTALVWNARHLAQAAAQHGARLARTAPALQPAGLTDATTTAPASVSGGGLDSDPAVQASTLSFLRQAGGHTLANPTVTISHDRSYVTVTVTGVATGALPGTTVVIRAASRTPIEGFRP